MSYNFRYTSIKTWKYNNTQWRLGSNNNGTAAHLGCPGDLPAATSDVGRSPWPPQLHRRSEKTCISFISDCGDKCNNWHHFSLSMPCVLSSVSRCCLISKTTITKTMSTNADGNLHGITWHMWRLLHHIHLSVAWIHLCMSNSTYSQASVSCCVDTAVDNTPDY